VHYEQHGHIYDLSRSERPPKLDLEGEQGLIRSLVRDPKANSDVFGEIVNVSKSTVRRIAHKHGYHSRICRKKPMITPHKSREEDAVGDRKPAAGLGTSYL